MKNITEGKLALLNEAVLKYESEINYIDSVLITNMSPLNDLVNERAQLVDELNTIRSQIKKAMDQLNG